MNSSRPTANGRGIKLIIQSLTTLAPQRSGDEFLVIQVAG
jgi:hypothetical protein